MKQLQIYVTEKNVTTLGPGNRYGLWVQGCNRRCPGCVAQNSQDPKGGRSVKVSALAWDILSSDAEGLTVSGGEPFLQAEALSELITLVKAKKNLGVIVYTGYCLEELEEVPYAKELLSQIDLLIDGPYQRELDDGKSLRGSSNQRVIPLTDRYVDALPLYGTENRRTQLFRHGSYVNIVGIPNQVAPKRID